MKVTEEEFWDYINSYGIKKIEKSFGLQHTILEFQTYARKKDGSIIKGWSSKVGSIILKKKWFFCVTERLFYINKEET